MLVRNGLGVGPFIILGLELFEADLWPAPVGPLVGGVEEDGARVIRGGGAATADELWGSLAHGLGAGPLPMVGAEAGGHG